MAPFQRVVWRRLLRAAGGAVLALATDGRAILAGSASGAFLAEQGAEAWVTLVLPPSWGRLELANPVALAPWGDRYVATPLGLFRQQPNGHWQRCLEGGAIVAVRTVLDGPRRTVVVADQLDGVLLSTNAGTDWEPAQAGLPLQLDILDLVLSPRFPEDRTALLVTEEGLFLSRSRRWSWHEVETAPSGLECGTVALDSQGRVVLSVGSEEGLFLSRDRGRTWQQVALPVQGACNALATDPTGHVLAAAIDHHIVRSLDGGERWERCPELPSQVLSLAVPEPDVVVAGTLAAGCLRWDTGAGRWLEWNAGLYGRLPLGIVTRRTGELLVADYSGTVFSSTDHGDTWESITLGRGIAQFAAGSSGPVYALALDALLRAEDGRAWEPIRPIEELSESSWLLTSDDGRTVCLVEYALQETLEPLVSLHISTDSGSTWRTVETDRFALVQGAALSADGRALALLALRTEDLRHSLSILPALGADWQDHPWPQPLPDTSMVRLLWSSDGNALLVVAETDVWLVERPLERPRIARAGRLDNSASAVGRASRSDWFLASGTRLWHCTGKGTLRALAGEGPEHTIVALCGAAEPASASGYAADVGGSIWSFVLGEHGASAETGG